MRWIFAHRTAAPLAVAVEQIGRVAAGRRRQLRFHPFRLTPTALTAAGRMDRVGSVLGRSDRARPAESRGEELQDGGPLCRWRRRCRRRLLDGFRLALDGRGGREGTEERIALFLLLDVVVVVLLLDGRRRRRERIFHAEAGPEGGRAVVVDGREGEDGRRRWAPLLLDDERRRAGRSGSEGAPLVGLPEERRAAGPAQRAGPSAAASVEVADVVVLRRRWLVRIRRAGPRIQRRPAAAEALGSASAAVVGDDGESIHRIVPRLPSGSAEEAPGGRIFVPGEGSDGSPECRNSILRQTFQKEKKDGREKLSGTLISHSGHMRRVSDVPECILETKTRNPDGTKERNVTALKCRPAAVALHFFCLQRAQQLSPPLPPGR